MVRPVMKVKYNGSNTLLRERFYFGADRISDKGDKGILKRILIVAFLLSLLCFLYGCSDKQTKDIVNPAEIIHIDGEKVNLSDFLGDSFSYALIDLNGDGNDDLIVLKDYQLYIIDYTSNKVVYIGYSFEQVYEDGTHTGIFYERPGGAPLHTDYQVYSFDAEWNCNIENAWSVYDEDLDDDYDENDVYFWNGEEIPYFDWTEKTSNYLKYPEYFVELIEVTQ